MGLIPCVLDPACASFFFFNDTATTEIYTLSLHDALPIFVDEKTSSQIANESASALTISAFDFSSCSRDRKSTRLNSSHRTISYAVFCLKKKKSTPPRSDCTSGGEPRPRRLARISDVRATW